MPQDAKQLQTPQWLVLSGWTYAAHLSPAAQLAAYFCKRLFWLLHAHMPRSAMCNCLCLHSQCAPSHARQLHSLFYCQLPAEGAAPKGIKLKGPRMILRLFLLISSASCPCVCSANKAGAPISIRAFPPAHKVAQCLHYMTIISAQGLRRFPGCQGQDALGSFPGSVILQKVQVSVLFQVSEAATQCSILQWDSLLGNSS